MKSGTIDELNLMTSQRSPLPTMDLFKNAHWSLTIGDEMGYVST